MATVEETLARLKKSRFRASFSLGKADREYAKARGEEVIRSHAEDFVRERLAPASPKNDGRQTPMRGHPVFVAQHACACCCRGCLERWYKIPRGVELSDDMQRRIVKLLMAWISAEVDFGG